MATLNQEQLRRLARLGAVARLEQLRQEETAIRTEFPELFGRGRGQDGAAAAPAKPAKATTGRPRKRRRRRMSAEARQAAADRMRKYWAQRREATAAS